MVVYSIYDAFSVQLFSVGTFLDNDSKENYRQQTQLFLGELLGLLETTPVTNVTIQIMNQTLLSSSSSSGERYHNRRRRKLQAMLLPIQIDMYVQGMTTATTLAENNITLGALCRQLFYGDKGSVFLQMLKDTKDPAFGFADRVESVGVVAVDDNAFPTSAPTTPLLSSATAAPLEAPRAGDDDDDGMDLFIIVAIAVGGAGLLILVVLCV
jgi:hypothetical protein